MKSVLKIYSDRECRVYKDMEVIIGVAAIDKPLKIALLRGRYYFILEDASDSSKRIELDYHMESDDTEDVMRVSFASNNVSCENNIRLLSMEQVGSLKRYIKRYLEPTTGTTKESFSILEPETNFEIPLKYDRVEHFQDGLARVRLYDKKGYIDKMGQIVIPIIHNPLLHFEEGLIWGSKDYANNYGCLNKNGELVIPYGYNNVNGFSGGVAIVQNKNSYWGCIDKKGNTIIPFEYKSKIGSISHLGDKGDSGFYTVSIGGKFALFDAIGNRITEFKYADVDKTMNNKIYGTGLLFYSSNSKKIVRIPVQIDNKFGFINEMGDEVIECKYDGVSNYVRMERKTRYSPANSPIVYDILLAAVKVNGKYGFIDIDGNIIKNHIYREAECIYDDVDMTRVPFKLYLNGKCFAMGDDYVEQYTEVKIEKNMECNYAESFPLSDYDPYKMYAEDLYNDNLDADQQSPDYWDNV